MVLLLDNKASIDPKSRTRTPLVAATCAGRLETARTLVDRGADVNARTSAQTDQITALMPVPGQTALGCAAQQRNVEFIRFLLDKGADINAASSDGRSPLHLALEQNVTRDMETAVASALLLISRGANVNATIPEVGTTPLDLAVQNRLLEVVRALLDKGANPNKGTARSTPLTSALGGNRPGADIADIALLLIDRGADVNAGGRRSTTPLFLAIQARQVGVVRALLAKGADPNTSSDSRGQTPLRAAAESPEIMQLLINCGRQTMS